MVDKVNHGRLVGVKAHVTAIGHAGVLAAVKGMLTGYDSIPIVTVCEVGGFVLKYTVVTVQVTRTVNVLVTEGIAG